MVCFGAQSIVVIRTIGQIEQLCTQTREFAGRYDHFVPQQQEPLYKWLQDAARYTDGRKVKVDNFSLNIKSKKMLLSMMANLSSNI